MHFKMQVHCSRVIFFFSLWPEVSLRSSLSFVHIFFIFYFIDCFFLFFLALGTGLFTFLWAWPMFDLHFLILGHQVVSIMCEKCLLYSFKKFQAEYKSLYKYLSTYYGGVLSVCWVAPSDSFSFCRRTLKKSFFCFVFASGRITNVTALADVKVLIVHPYYCFVSLLNIDEHLVYE